MSDQRESLDQLLASLPREVQPERDLWRGIQAEIAKTPIVTDSAPVVHFSRSRWMQLAAGVLLVLATSLTTFVITRQSLQQDPVEQVANQPVPTPALNAMPASFGPEVLGAEYLQARSDLNKRFEERIKSLPPSATLADHPSDPLLQDLLMSTYQRELQLLADVSEVPVSNTVRTDL
jgi:hypothetical protein